MKSKYASRLHFAMSELPECHMIISDDFHFKYHRHKGFFEIDYLFEGTLKENVNGREYTFVPGSLIFIRENDEHDLRGKNIKFINITLCRKILQTSEKVNCMLNGNDLPYVIIPPNARAGFEALLNEMFSKQDTLEGKLLCNRFFYDVMLEWFVPQLDCRQRAMPEWLAGTIMAMESADMAEWSVEKIVKKCCRSREHVARTFQTVFGCSMSGYMNRMKLEKARKQLIYTNMFISDICFDSGFNNINYFYRLFRKKYCETPAEYRRKNSHVGWGGAGGVKH